ncbi:Creatinase/aminopeptidase [Teratosphaeria nubilosa]|uniref:Creatinase/aminopeptidase n=1 Tax=Teratosphaeria nubilosa TaxID=161662 RepID=A0A6G1L8F0_9PEZI|nr:Creatinase/aminopeptidase [Teratosphaeria nubilosa]
MDAHTSPEERERAASLRDAESKAQTLFSEIERTLLRPGVTEKQLDQEIKDLGEQRYNVRTHWHKRVVRSGPNTLAPFQENPPDRTITDDDILYVDLGPVFEKWEADFGRTYVLGDDPHKKKLRDATEPMFYRIKERYKQRPEMTGEELYEIAGEEARKDGWEWGAHIAGHNIGDFPHERIPNDKITFFVTPGNKKSMAGVDKDGHRRHWILEVHLWDKERDIKAFFEQLLTVD